MRQDAPPSLGTEPRCRLLASRQPGGCQPPGLRSPAVQGWAPRTGACCCGAGCAACRCRHHRHQKMKRRPSLSRGERRPRERAWGLEGVLACWQAPSCLSSWPCRQRLKEEVAKGAFGGGGGAESGGAEGGGAHEAASAEQETGAPTRQAVAGEQPSGAACLEVARAVNRGWRGGRLVVQHRTSPRLASPVRPMPARPASPCRSPSGRGARGAQVPAGGSQARLR